MVGMAGAGGTHTQMTGNGTGNGTMPIKILPLNSYPVAVQEGILLRELILALAGVEGVYLRVGAYCRDEKGKKLYRLNQIKYVIDTDSSMCIYV
jgi:hypothetical protein